MEMEDQSMKVLTEVCPNSKIQRELGPQVSLHTDLALQQLIYKQAKF